MRLKIQTVPRRNYTVSPLQRPKGLTCAGEIIAVYSEDHTELMKALTLKMRGSIIVKAHGWYNNYYAVAGLTPSCHAEIQAHIRLYLGCEKCRRAS